jgi:hypothetical protein
MLRRKSLNLQGIRLPHHWEPATLPTSDRLPIEDSATRRSERARTRLAMETTSLSRAEASPACQKKVYRVRSVHQVQGLRASHQRRLRGLVLSGRIVRGARGLQGPLLFRTESRVVTCLSAHLRTDHRRLRTSTNHLVSVGLLQCPHRKHVSQALVIDRLHLLREWVVSCKVL